MKNCPQMQKGLTLLEILIVLIIIGVSSGLAIPRFHKTIQYTYLAEAQMSINVIRQAMERCRLLQGTDRFIGCYLNSYPIAMGSIPPYGNTLDIEDPAKSSNAHFNYFAAGIGMVDPSFMIEADRNALGGGDPASDYIYRDWTYSSADPSYFDMTCEGGGVYEGWVCPDCGKWKCSSSE